MVTARLVLTGFVVLALASVLSSQNRHSPEFETLEGTWNMNITPVGRAPAQILSTFTRGGSAIGNGNAANPSNRSSWQGVWSRLSYLEFESTWERYDFDASGNLAGRSELRLRISVNRNLEEFTGQSQTRIFNAAGALTNTVQGTLQAARVNVRSLE